MNRELIRSCIEAAFAEDSPLGDLTTDSLFAPDERARAVFVARQDGVLAGVEVLREAFAFVDDTAHVNVLSDDGQRFKSGQRIARVESTIRGLLRAERIALNFTQRLSGIASLTREFVDAVQHTNAKIVDTRKTTPGMRALERYAVRCGGGTNHRFSLSDAVLVKDNHLAFLNSSNRDVTESLRNLAATVPFTAHIEVEVDRLDQIEAVLQSGVVDSVLIDNFSIEDTVAAVKMINGRALVNASGGVATPGQARIIAETGVDLISIGALTHSAAVIDIGLDAIEGVVH